MKTIRRDRRKRILTCLHAHRHIPTNLHILFYLAGSGPIVILGHGGSACMRGAEPLASAASLREAGGGESACGGAMRSAQTPANPANPRARGWVDPQARTALRRGTLGRVGLRGFSAECRLGRVLGGQELVGVLDLRRGEGGGGRVGGP